MNEVRAKYQDLLLWMALTSLYYIVYQVRYIRVDKRVLVHAVDMVFILCFMPDKLDFTVPYCLLLLMMSHWMHYFARKHVKPLDKKYLPKVLAVLLGLDALLMFCYYNFLGDGSLQDRLMQEQAFLTLHALHTLRLWHTSKARQEPCELYNHSLPQTISFFDKLEFFGATYICLWHWPAVGMGNLLYSLKICFVAINRALYVSKLEGHERAVCAICRKHMDPTHHCGWARQSSGHYYQSCCAMASFLFRLMPTNLKRSS
ncbi:Hypothetical predicted protein [Drosophila guanche]|uniref:Uncharacterized protein n=1 Tax=Drosophila guanche TaxID=7266 RepID=A0A3B0JWY7_DROGU|nr:Hypothetical predicted protein [Drosophila guanche]